MGKELKTAKSSGIVWHGDCQRYVSEIRQTKKQIKALFSDGKWRKIKPDCIVRWCE